MNRTWLICSLLAITTAGLYGQVVGFDFINFDDPDYVQNNPHVQAGLSVEGIGWAFTFTDVPLWQPLTWLSLMLDAQLFGPGAGGFHATNVLLHIINTLLLFFLLRSMTGAVWPSAFVAALFAMHPLRVESVAWVVERKDVLSTCFGFMSVWTYARYAAGGKSSHYLLTLVFMAMSLMAKPMLVTLPFLLLLLDLWPLKRLAGVNGTSNPGVVSLVVEKIPLMVLSFLSSAMTIVFPQKAGTVYSLEALPLLMRIGNAAVSYVRYIGKMFWPSELCVLYLHPMFPGGLSLELWMQIVAAIALFGISGLAIALRRHRYLLTGWFWFLGTLVPVIGLAQVGEQAMADRFAYFPLIGLFIIVAWGFRDMIEHWHWPQIPVRPIATTAAVCLLAALTAISWAQLRHWRDSESLFNHALKLNPDNWIIHNHLASVLSGRQRLDEAVDHYRRAVELRPQYAEAHNNLCPVLGAQGEFDEAIKHGQTALRFHPNYPEAHFHLAVAFEAQGELDDAIDHYRKGLQTRDDQVASLKLADVLSAKGMLDEAISNYQQAVTIQPSPEVYYSLGSALRKNGDLAAAERAYRDALELNTDMVQALNGLAWLLATSADPSFHKPAEALQLAQRAVALQEPAHPALLDTLAAAQAANGQFDEAVTTAEEALIRLGDGQNEEVAKEVRMRIELFQRGKMYLDVNR